MIEITDWEIPELKWFQNRNETQLLHYFEPEPGIFIAESPNVILRALEAGYEPLCILTESKTPGKMEKQVLESTKVQLCIAIFIWPQQICQFLSKCKKAV